MGRSLALITALNGKTFKKIFIGGGRWLTLHRHFLNRLNVYPVPDGDTGTNMSFTIRGALRALAYSPSSQTISQAAQKAASGALWEAHGNSGVILSQILHGFACSLNNKTEASIKDLTVALRQGSEFAYRALQRPAEGTILSFIRILGEKAEQVLSQKSESDLVSFLHKILTESQVFFDFTDNDDRPEALRQAQTVDAGALGLYFFFAGMLRVAQRRSLWSWETNDSEATFIKSLKFGAIDSVPFAQIPNYQYCSEFLLTDCPENIKEEIETKLATWGDSLVMAQTPKLLKIHLHTNNPQVISDILLQYGRLIDSKKDDLTEQCRVRQKEILWKRNPNPQTASHNIEQKGYFSATHLSEVAIDSTHNFLSTTPAPIQIITDSTCDLSPELLNTLGIISVPLRINLNGRSYLDNHNFSPKQLAELLNQQQEPMEISTAHPSPYDFATIYQSYPNHLILSLHPSAFLSGSYNAACQAAAQIDPKQERIKVINSNSISIGLGCLIIETANFIAANPLADLNEVSSYFESLAKKTHLLFTVPSLQYLIKGGRLRTPKQKLERLLKAYYIFSYSGETSIAPLARSLNLDRALSDIAQRVKAENAQHHVRKIFVAYSPNLKSPQNTPVLDPSQTISSLSRELQKLNLPAPLFKTETGCAVSVHCGSGAVGIAYLID